MKRIAFLVILSFFILWAQEGARYLVITNDSFYEAIQPLAQWKHKKGMMSKVVRLSEIGSTNTQIRNYIVNAYNTWNPRPEFVLLVGSQAHLPSWARAGYYTDNEYCNITGDYRAEIPYGRFICKTVSQCSTMVAKALRYERNPDTGDSLWFRKLSTIVRTDGDPDDSIYFRDARFAATGAINNSYVWVDTFSDIFGHSATDVINAINNGRTFVLFRGCAVGDWPMPFDVNPQATNNGAKLPIICSFTCATMTLSPGESMVGDAWVKTGTVANPKGAVAFVGNTEIGSGVALIRSAMTRGFFTGVFIESLKTLGACVIRGKNQIYIEFNCQNEYEGFNLLGDPELNFWTGTPIPLTVSHPSAIRIGPQTFQVSVLKRRDPVEGALVCVMMTNGLYGYGYTDDSGNVSLSINPAEVGLMDITVTAQNSYPYEDSIQVIPPTGAYLIYFGGTIDDLPPRGNGDGYLNPGETILLSLALKNIGDTGAYGVTAFLRSSDRFLTITDSISDYGDILPESVTVGERQFGFYLSPACTNNYQLTLKILARSEVQDSWSSTFSIMVKAGRLTFQGSAISDSAPGGNNNGRFEPGESGKLLVTLKNSGSAGLSQVRAILRTDDLFLAITDSTATYGSILPGQERTNTQDYFALSISPSVYPGARVNLRVIKIGNGGTYEFRDSSQISFVIGTGQATSPTGPDAYGYYAYDNTDESSGRAPTYNWCEISSIGQLITEITNSNDTVVTKPLPFGFRYYEIDYDSISISSNGFITMGRTNSSAPNNAPIPWIGEPRAVIASFWDDFDLSAQTGYGDAYQYFDAANHCFIIEFKQAAHSGTPGRRETFQLILYDPAYFPTLTGDGEILFQYLVVNNSRTNSIGIEDHTETRGIQYLYENYYDPTAAMLQAGRAIKFTTNRPLAESLPWLTIHNFSVNDSLGGNGNGIPEPDETFNFTIELLNQGTALVQNVTGIIRAVDNDVMVLDSSKTYGDIPAGGLANNSSNPYRLQVVPSPADSIAEFLLILNGNSGNYNTVIYFSLSLGGVIDVAENSELRIPHFEFSINPNPFKVKTIIRFTPNASRTSDTGFSLRIYDITGKLVKSFSTSPQSPVTSNYLVWDGTDERGVPVNSGLYFVVYGSGKGQGYSGPIYKTIKLVRLK